MHRLYSPWNKSVSLCGGPGLTHTIMKLTIVTFVRYHKLASYK